MEYDAIIIGSGLGGLSCAACLSLKGWKVLVLEKHSKPGGYATNFIRGDFTFDASLHMIPGVGKGQHHYRWFEWCGIADKIEFIKLKEFGRLVFPDYDIRLPSGDLAKIISILEEKFPHEKEGIKCLFNEMTKIHNDCIKFIFSNTPFWLQLPVFPFRYKALFHVLSKTGSQILDKYLKDEKLKALLFANWFFFGLPPSKLNSFFSVFPNMGYRILGAYYPKGSTQAIPNAFSDVIKENHGEIIFNSEATSIITQRGKAIGVKTRKGEKYFGKNVISNASARETFYNLVGREELPKRFIKKLEKMIPSISAFSVYLGLNNNFRRGLENKEDYEIFFSETYDQDVDYAWSLNGNVEKASFVISLYSNIDKSLAKGEKFILGLAMTQGYEYWKRFESDYISGRKDIYNKEKKRMAKILIERAERVIPNISKHIEVMEVATPLTFKRYTGNYHGAIYGWANTVRQGNPIYRLKQKTPIKNLYLSSAWTFPGEGQLGVMMSGYRLGRMLTGK
ncbi:MAG: NAD(P)/FAD-dependent oxidoreductase [Thermodesulfovibrionales bacterium]